MLDEFQNIAHFDDSLDFQKNYRAYWQTHQHCSYAIYGSKQHMMAEIRKKSMPFYKFGEIFSQKLTMSTEKVYREPFSENRKKNTSQTRCQHKKP